MKATLAIFLIIPMLLFSVDSYSMSRWQIKKQIRKEYKECRKTQSFKYCWAEKKQKRLEAGVRFKDDLIYAKSKIKEAIEKIGTYVQIESSADEEGARYVKMTIKIKKLKFSEMHKDFPGYKSYFEMVPTDEGSEIAMYLYEQDLFDHTNYQALSIPGERSFPVFNGATYDTLNGLRHDFNGTTVDFYADAGHMTFGTFIENAGSGKAIAKINEWKNKVKILQSMPDLAYIPIPILYKWKQIAKINLMAADANGENAGILIRIDFNKMKELSLLQ